MGDPAEENDPPPESPRFLTKDLQSVNWKTKKNLSLLSLSCSGLSFPYVLEPNWIA